MSQIRGSCGHLKASWDNHSSCFTCSHCSFESRCATCKLWTSSVWTLAVNRRSYKRRRSTKEKKMDKKGAASKQSGSGTATKQSGTALKQSQSENPSQTASASGENYRENRENSPIDTRQSAQDRPGGSSTQVSADKRTERTPNAKSGDSLSSSSGPDSLESDRSPGRESGRSPGGKSGRSPGRDSRDRSFRPKSKDRSSKHRYPDRVTRSTSRYRSVGRSTSRQRSRDRSSRHPSAGRSFRHRSPGRSSRHRAPGQSTRRHSRKRSDRHRSPRRTSRDRSKHRSSSRDRHTPHRRHRSRVKRKNSRSRRLKRHHHTSSSSDSYSRSSSISSDWSTSSDRHRRHKKKSHNRSSVSRSHKRRRHSYGTRHKDRARALSSSSDRNDNLSIRVDNNEFEGESRAGSPHKASSNLAKKTRFDRGSSNSEEEEEGIISFAEAIQEVMSLLPSEFCPRKESSETLQRPRSTLDALNPSEDKSSASLPQSLLIKDVVNVFQSLIDKKVKLEPGWVTNKSLERDLGINVKHYRSHGQLFPDSVPKIDKDASLLDLISSGNANLPVKSLETMERQARNMVSINSYADLFTAASVQALESDNLDAPMLKRLLSSIVSCLKHSSSMAVILAVELLQARREAAIERSKILTEATKTKLRSVPISAESLFGGMITDFQKLNSESQQQSFIASSVAQSKQASTSGFKIPKCQKKSAHRDSSSSTRPPNHKNRGGPRRGSRRGGSSSRGRGQYTPSRGGASNVSRQ